MNDTLYWIWLSEALSQGSNCLELVSYYNWDPKRIYDESVRDIFALDIYSLSKIKKFKAYPLEKAEKSLNAAISLGMKIITPTSEYYPKSLKVLNDLPLVLYVYGDETVLKNELSISIVGARNASAYGCAVAKALSGALSTRGFTIVSGGAKGIDCEAHFGALDEGGKTICVLGCGLNTNYLMDLSVMRQKIANSGAVISEYPPFFPASRKTFPIRNRIISGISLGTVVVEAGERSGSLITARLALEQGKNIFAVPGDLVQSSYLGTNNLIRDGATIVFSPNDILGHYSSKYYDKIKDTSAFPNDELIRRAQEILNAPKQENQTVQNQAQSNIPKPQKVKQPTPDYLTANAKIVYEALNNEPQHVDAIAEKVGLTMSNTLSALTELEVYALVEALSGRRYTIK